MTHTEVKQVLDTADANKDGKLDYFEVSFACVFSYSNATPESLLLVCPYHYCFIFRVR